MMSGKVEKNIDDDFLEKEFFGGSSDEELEELEDSEIQSKDIDFEPSENENDAKLKKEDSEQNAISDTELKKTDEKNNILSSDNPSIKKESQLVITQTIDDATVDFNENTNLSPEIHLLNGKIKNPENIISGISRTKTPENLEINTELVSDLNISLQNIPPKQVNGFYYF
ncbi:hypothetical protein AYI68_g6786 [Smittium mucronatum]|uniref:Uncharacterized protein n=1 Tax=Smittium mucronatum TaxID=133383 RepID=A0A1R0GQH4_9FUNG|nr:hypothetical protein AYI68_g6786 [Smittium mucronatum]